MKTIIVQELSEHHLEWLEWIKAGEEVAVSRDGQVIARIVPEKPMESAAALRTLPATKVDWTTSAAFTRDRTGERILTAEESTALRHEAGGRW